MGTSTPNSESAYNLLRGLGPFSKSWSLSGCPKLGGPPCNKEPKKVEK